MFLNEKLDLGLVQKPITIIYLKDPKAHTMHLKSFLITNKKESLTDQMNRALHATLKLCMQL